VLDAVEQVCAGDPAESLAQERLALDSINARV